MCSANDDPTTYDVTQPESLGRGSVALAVLGELLTESERDLDMTIGQREVTYLGDRIAVLREARAWIAAAEAGL